MSSQYRHGGRWFYAIATFWQAEPTKTRVQELTRTSILGHSHTQAKIVVAVVGVVVVPFTDDAVLRVILPAAATYDAVSTGSSTLLMSLPFNTPTAFNLQSNRNGTIVIVFVELLRKNPKIFEPLKRLTSAVTSYFQN